MLHSLSPILPARVIVDAAVFYARLGFAVTYQDEDYLIVKRDGAEVHFWRNADLDPARNDAGAYLRPDDIDALDREWRAVGLPARGIPRYVPAENKPWGMREAALIDPEGNLIRAGQEMPLG